MIEYLEVAAVAKRLNVSASTVYRLIKKKKLRCGFFGVEKGIRVYRDSLIEFEQKRTKEQQVI